MGVTCSSTKRAPKINLHVKLLKCLVAYQIHDLDGGEGRKKVMEVYAKGIVCFTIAIKEQFKLQIKHHIKNRKM